MSGKNINARVQHKHDTQANWEKAVNFIPLDRELIIYDKDENHNYERFKLGDGVTNVNDLEFLEAIRAREDEESAIFYTS